MMLVLLSFLDYNNEYCSNHLATLYKKSAGVIRINLPIINECSNHVDEIRKLIFVNNITSIVKI